VEQSGFSAQRVAVDGSGVGVVVTVGVIAAMAEGNADEPAGGEVVAVDVAGAVGVVGGEACPAREGEAGPVGRELDFGDVPAAFPEAAVRVLQIFFDARGAGGIGNGARFFGARA